MQIPIYLITLLVISQVEIAESVREKPNPSPENCFADELVALLDYVDKSTRATEFDDSDDGLAEALPQLATKHHSLEVRAIAVRLLPRFLGRGAQSILTTALKDDQRIQFYAVRGLLDLGCLVEFVSLDWEFRVRDRESQDWTLASKDYMPDSQWIGMHPHRGGDGIIEATWKHLSVDSSGKIDGSIALLNIIDRPVSIDLREWRVSLARGLRLWHDGRSYMRIQPSRLGGHIEVGGSDWLNDGERILGPGGSLEMRIELTGEKYDVIVINRGRPEREIDCIPSHDYIVEAAISVSPRLVHRIKNPLSIQVSTVCDESLEAEVVD